MPTEPAPFIWYELIATAPDAAATFYGEVVGWTVHDSGQPGIDYRVLMAGETAVGGLMAMPEGAGFPPAWFAYVGVPDVDACIAATIAAGGAVCMPARDIPGIGRIAMIIDPQGAALYVMTPIGEGQSGAFAHAIPGRAGWNELRTSDPAAALAFYQAGFGWLKAGEMSMGPAGTYHLFGRGAEPIGGMMSSPNFPHPSWLIYFNVADIDAALARLTAAGGTLQFGPQEVPGGGFVLHARDPQGIFFALTGPRVV